MDVNASTALVTGANRGLGRHFVMQLLARGARKVYATARDPRSTDLADLEGVEVLRVDITDQQTVDAAAEAARDVDLLINNAGVATMQNLVTGDLARIRLEMDTHFWGTLAMVRAFAPALGRNGGGAVVNVMSVGSFHVYPGNGAYHAAKAAQWALSNSSRLELAAQGTHVMGLHLSSTDTDMMAGWDVPKNDPADVVRAALDGLQEASWEVLADSDTISVKARLSAPPWQMYPQLVDPA